MKQLQLLLRDRRRRQRGSILSGVLIIVAFLSILVGALLTSLTDSFTLTREMADRFTNEATATSTVELAINQLQAGPVPAVCVQDASNRGPWFLTLNGRSAVVTQTCSGILPELLQVIAAGSTVDGVHVTIGGQDRYLVADSSGLLSVFNSLGQILGASVPIGGPPTAPLLVKVSGSSSVLLIPAAIGGPLCSGRCVALFKDTGLGLGPLHICDMPASTTVTATPAIDTTAGGSTRFPNYAFFGGSGAAGRLYVYDASCLQKSSALLGGGVIGAPLVFPGQGIRGIDPIVNDEIFVLVSDGGTTSLQHWQYRETTNCNRDCDSGNLIWTPSLARVSTLTLTGYVGGSAVGYAINSTVPTVGTNLTLALAGTSGQMATVRIAVNSGPSYSMSGVVSSIALPGGVSRPPYWCHCPGNQDVLGVGSTNGNLYLLNTGLVVQWSYDGSPTGSPAINTTPAADAKGDWYFGASDGAVYDVEIPVSGSQMFRAARVSLGGTITGSPIVAACPGGPCVYLATSTASYLLRIGTTRISELRACVSTGPGSTTCAANPRLWARVQVGPAAIWGGNGVFVEGWSFYSP